MTVSLNAAGATTIGAIKNLQQKSTPAFGSTTAYKSNETADEAMQRGAQTLANVMKALVHKPTKTNETENINNTASHNHRNEFAEEQLRLTPDASWNGHKTIGGLQHKSLEDVQNSGFTTDKNGILKNSCGWEYTGVISTQDVMHPDNFTFVEYKDGKPITLVKSEAQRSQMGGYEGIERKIVHYEYSNDFYGAVKTEKTYIHSDVLGENRSSQVPNQITKEIGLEL